MTGNAEKKPKVADTPPMIRPSIITDPTFRQQLSEEYKTSTPYPHCMIKELCDPKLLRKVRDEIIDNVEATYKETDLFKMLQTGDLANLDKLDEESAAKLPTLLALRDSIYSPEFRHFISDVTGCGELSDHTDCACNIHTQSGHLLCHDDVIGNRKVSYIVYLVDPDNPWTAEDGGALELYPESKETKHQPDVVPTATILPTWNAMAMFMVKPGQSFHSIQEVYTGEKPRMSIQGWFHGPTAPENAQLATLKQLQASAGEDDKQGLIDYTSADTDGALSDEDLAVLVKYINPQYLSEDVAAKVRAKFEEDGSVQLRSFLRPDKAKEIGELCAAADAEDELGRGAVPRYDAGIGGGWKAIGPPHKQRFLSFHGSSGSANNTTNNKEKAGAALEKLQIELLQSPAFARFIHKMTTLTLLSYKSQVRRFRAGLDYTVAHYGGLTTDPMLDAVWCWVADTDAGDASSWEAGDVGGFEAYLLADDDGKGSNVEAEEVYRAGDEDTGVLNVSAASNTLNLVLRDEGLMRFVKYVSCQAPSSRWDVSCLYKPDDDSDDEE